MQSSRRHLSNTAPRPPYSSGKNIFVPVANGSGPDVQIPNVFLRDNCQCTTCVHDVTKQKLSEIQTLDLAVAPQQCTPTPTGLQIRWTDGHESFYTTAWLRKRAHQLRPSQRKPLPSHDHARTLWDARIRAAPPTVPYAAIMDTTGPEAGVARWTAALRTHGVCYVDGCPTTAAATEALLTRLAFIRPTHYGGFWDFTADLASADTAYTSLALPAHTDTTYFSDPAGLQLFHLLEHRGGSGGASLLVDGFAVAARLRAEFPRHYDVLRAVRVWSHASGNEDACLRPCKPFPVIVEEEGEVVQVRWNDNDRAAVWPRVDPGIRDPAAAAEQVERWYEAAKIWAQLLQSEEFEYWEQLKPGRPMIFDNWRVLHGRSSFTGKRRLCGGYINHDDFMSRYRLTNFGRSQILSDLGLDATETGEH